MLSRNFSQITNNVCQLQTKTLPPRIEFLFELKTIEPPRFS